MRHVNIREVAVRDAIRNAEIRVGHIPGRINIADIFTKEIKDDKHYLHIVDALLSLSIKATE
eukprot:425198-Ditylum_brightwellii.AAC.1